MILVIGGTGFIGKNLLWALHRSGRKAISMSRQPDQTFLEAQAPSVEALTVEEFHADPATALFGVNAVIYLASTSTPGANLDNPWREVQDNVDPLLRVLKAVQLYRAQAHVIFLSSGGTVYGQTRANKIVEDTLLHPISVYGMGKKMMESAVTFMADHHGLRTTTLRPANPVGRWQKGRSQGVVGVLLRAARSGDTFPMQGDGSAVRDYFDVADLCDAIIATVAQPEASRGQVFNVGSGEGRSVREILEMVEAVTGREVAVETVPVRSSDVERVVLDTMRIETTLGWRPTRTLQETIRAIWDRQEVKA